uniref:Uncharacterized protein n=1 Tax=uncultured prokaryote TaxID=198431 RepID=A0A0H5Q2U3_9ZZZZ|nr:hypothetical protein [uncultured prokaryote]
MRIKYEYAGTITRRDYLEVAIERVDGHTRRVFTVQIPWSELCDMGTLSEIDRAVKRELLERWSSSPFEQDQIPGIG